MDDPAAVSDENTEDEPGVDDLEGRYANHFRIGYNAFEFVIDFGQFYEGHKEARNYTRIITSPIYVKELLMLLDDTVKDYEEDFGPILDKD